jgi:putative CRISPR-associated protein (TIGR02619 family)
VRCIVSTCGTSILTNLEGNKRRETSRNGAEISVNFTVNGVSNKKEEDLSKEERNFVDSLLEELWENIKKWGTEKAKKESAELNALLAYYGAELRDAKGDTHYFVHSDTYVGKECAKLAADWWKRQGFKNSHTNAIGGLNTADYWSFREAMCELATWCHNNISPMRHPPHDRVAFNLTGGFKSVQGFMQALGMLYADEMFYLFQGSDELMRIPRLPFDIDTGARQEIEKHFDVYRKLSIGGVSVTSDEIDGIPESMVFTDGINGCTLSAWGEIFWNKFKRNLYEKQFYGPPLPNIRLSDKFYSARDEFGADGHAKYSINERLDDLAKYILSTRRYNPDRLNVHQYHSAGKSKWECYAWSDGAAYRILFHFEGGDRIELDDLIPHDRL